MNALDELKYYCNELNPVGAILLTGEWGCGKTYLINNELTKALSDSSIILRVSLFGTSKLDEINTRVKIAWAEAYYKEHGIKKYTDKIENTKKFVAKFNFFSEKVKDITSTTIYDLFTVENTIVVVNPILGQVAIEN